MSTYEGAGDFLDKLKKLGVKFRKSEDDFDGHDYDTMTSETRLEVPVESVTLYRESEHYFCTSIVLENGNMIHVEAPINKIGMSDRLADIKPIPYEAPNVGKLRTNPKD